MHPQTHQTNITETTSKRRTQILVTTDISIVNMPSALPSILLSPSTRPNTSSNPRVSFSTPSRPEPLTRTSAMNSEKKGKTMAELDKQHEVQLAKTHWKRNALAEKLRALASRLGWIGGPDLG
jgi:hypothetical protein